MSTRTSRIVAALTIVAGSVALLAGCAAPMPSEAEILERFQIEVEAAHPDMTESGVQEMAELFAKSAEEDCKSEEFWDFALTTGNTDYQYVWAASCSVLYDDAYIGEYLAAEYKNAMMASIAEDLTTE